jgi:hypothetical protein
MVCSLGDDAGSSVWPPGLPRSRLSFCLARWSRSRNATRVCPSAAAACLGVRPSQARSVIASRSSGLSRLSASATRLVSLAAAGSSSAAGELSRATFSVSAILRRAERCCVASTRRVTESSQGSGSAGRSSRRRHATRKVSATASSTSSAGPRRCAYRATTGAKSRKTSSNRTRPSVARSRSVPPTTQLWPSSPQMFHRFPHATGGRLAWLQAFETVAPQCSRSTPESELLGDLG